MYIAKLITIVNSQLKLLLYLLFKCFQYVTNFNNFCEGRNVQSIKEF